MDRYFLKHLPQYKPNLVVLRKNNHQPHADLENGKIDIRNKRNPIDLNCTLRVQFRQRQNLNYFIVVILNAFDFQSDLGTLCATGETANT